jgi:hypothetical protein
MRRLIFLLVLLAPPALAKEPVQQTTVVRGPAFATRSASPRVTAAALHPASMDATQSWGVVIDGQPGPRFFNYQVQLVLTPPGTWIACWTQGGYESDANQRVVVARSRDGGRSWSSEVPVEEAGADCRVPAWGMPFVVPESGRVYVFYWFNYQGVKLRDAGDIFFRFSDDDGLTWSPRQRIGVPRSDIDRDELGDIHGWNFGQPQILPGGQVVFTYNKIRRSSLYPPGWRLTMDNRWEPDGNAKVDPARRPDHNGGSPNDWQTEVFLAELPNILTERDPAKLEFRFLPAGGSGLWAPYPGTSRHFGQEGTLTPLSGGRLLCVFRTRQGHPYYAVSSDRGATWTPPQVLRRVPGGEAFNQPCAPCPMFKLSDGRFVFLFHNTRPEGGGWYPRDPLWIAVGRETPGVQDNAGLSFTKPRVLVYNDGIPGGPFKDFEIGYPSLCQFQGRCYVAYANKTSQIRINEVPAPLLDDSELPATK